MSKDLAKETSEQLELRESEILSQLAAGQGPKRFAELSRERNYIYFELEYRRRNAALESCKTHARH